MSESMMVMQDDMRVLLDTLGLFSGARNQSPHEVMIDDIIPAVRALKAATPPIPMILTCPICNARHIDDGEFATKPHHTHACQGCGLTWRPAIVPTVGVQFLPGFKNGIGAR